MVMIIHPSVAPKPEIPFMIFGPKHQNIIRYLLLRKLLQAPVDTARRPKLFDVNIGSTVSRNCIPVYDGGWCHEIPLRLPTDVVPH